MLKDVEPVSGIPSSMPSITEEMRTLAAQAPLARDFHRGIPGYRVTPLLSLPNLAQRLGLKAVFVKDESQRFGLNAFKALGASYAMARLIAAEAKIETDLSPQILAEPKLRAQIAAMTFTTATEGNHGRGVAWAAARLGARAVIYMPQGAAPDRIRAIEGEGAEVRVTTANYDATVEIAQVSAQENGWHLVQDTATENYQTIPGWIAAGYLTMVEEMREQLKIAEAWPTHVFLQAGVGTMAGALTTWFTTQGVPSPQIGLMEPARAACYFSSMQANDGQPHSVGGALRSVMAGLNCGVPNPMMYPILREYTSSYFSCPDYVAARGMRLANAPFADDPRFVSGASGAVGLGLISLLGEHPEYHSLRRALRLNADSVVMLFSTEGNTDAAVYHRVIHDEAYATPDMTPQ